MDADPLMVHKFLNFPHEGSVLAVEKDIPSPKFFIAPLLDISSAAPILSPRAESPDPSMKGNLFDSLEDILALFMTFT